MFLLDVQRTFCFNSSSFTRIHLIMAIMGLFVYICIVFLQFVVSSLFKILISEFSCIITFSIFVLWFRFLFQGITECWCFGSFSLFPTSVTFSHIFYIFFSFLFDLKKVFLPSVLFSHYLSCLYAYVFHSLVLNSKMIFLMVFWILLYQLWLFFSILFFSSGLVCSFNLCII